MKNKPDQEQKTDLDELSYIANVSDVTENNVSSFIDQLVLTFQQQAAFRTLFTNDIDVFKFDGQDLVPTDIHNNANLVIKVNAKSTSPSFKGTKDILVSLTVTAQAVDLNKLNSTATVSGVSPGDINSFIHQLVATITTQQAAFRTLFTNDIDVFKFDGQDLVPTDIANNPKLAIKVNAKYTSPSFKGTANIRVTLTITSVDLNKVITDKNLGTIYIGNINQPTEEQIKSAIKLKYPLLQADKINIIDITKTIAKITSTDINVYIGEVTINFTISNFIEMKGTKGSIFSLTTDSSGNIYAGSLYGEVYKCLEGQTNFTEMTGAKGTINSLTTDSSGNVYAGSLNVYISNKKNSKFF